MKTIGTKKSTAVIGLDWLVLSDKVPVSKGVKSVLNDEGGAGIKYGVIFKFVGLTMLGTVPAGEAKPGFPSAAAWVALAHQAELERKRKEQGKKKKKSGKKKDAAETSEPAETLSGDSSSEYDQVWLIIEKIAEGQYWFLMVRDGVPLPGTDIVIDYQNAVQLMDEAINKQVVVFSNDAEIREQANNAGPYKVEEKSFDELVAGVRSTKALIKPLSGVSSAIILTLLLIVLAGGLFWGWSAWQKHQKQQAAQLAAQQASAEQARKLAQDQAAYDLAVREAVIAALKSGMAKVDATLVSPSAPDVVDAWVDIVENTSINHAGWDVSGFECLFEEGKPKCTISLARGQYGINRLLLEDHPDALLEGDKASYVVLGSEKPSRSTTFRELPQASEFTADFISELQFLHLAEVTYNLGESKEMTEAVKMPPMPASMFKPGKTAEVAPSGAVQLGVASGTLTLSGAKLWQLRGLRPLLGGLNLAALTNSIAATRAATGAWTLTVNYSIRTRPQPVLPAQLDSKGQPLIVDLPAEYRATPEEMARAAGGNVGASASSAPPPAAIENAVPAADDLPAASLPVAPQEQMTAPALPPPPPTAPPPAGA